MKTSKRRWIINIKDACFCTGACDCGQSTDRRGGVCAQSANPRTIITVCAPCHGVDGVGHDVETPNLAGLSGIYLHSQLVAFRNGSRKHHEMKFISRNLTDYEIDQVVL